MSVNSVRWAALRVRNFILTTFLSIVFGMSMNFLAHKTKKNTV